MNPEKRLIEKREIFVEHTCRRFLNDMRALLVLKNIIRVCYKHYLNDNKIMLTELQDQTCQEYNDRVDKRYAFLMKEGWTHEEILVEKDIRYLLHKKSNQSTYYPYYITKGQVRTVFNLLWWRYFMLFPRGSKTNYENGICTYVLVMLNEQGVKLAKEWGIASKEDKKMVDALQDPLLIQKIELGKGV